MISNKIVLKTTAVAKHTAKGICHVFCTSGLLFREGLILFLTSFRKAIESTTFDRSNKVVKKTFSSLTVCASNVK